MLSTDVIKDKKLKKTGLQPMAEARFKLYFLLVHTSILLYLGQRDITIKGKSSKFSRNVSSSTRTSCVPRAKKSLLCLVSHTDFTTK